DRDHQSEDGCVDGQGPPTPLGGEGLGGKGPRDASRANRQGDGQALASVARPLTADCSTSPDPSF
ncbi:MAG: hypothetical protein ACRDVL_02560, partial [Acidimicrobiia bacterium]